MKNRIKWLDELRGLAAFTVVLFHYFTNYDKHYSHSFVVPEFIKFGALGVNLFFIISGFVIFMTINKIKDVKSFAISRFSRLYPTFWVALLLSFSCTQFLDPDDRAVGYQTFFFNFSMIQEYLGFGHVDQVY
jgi:peptidoglycan/LPS O-acetylase OafA/YrhL